MAILPAQVVAGRALLGWSQDEFAAASGVARRTISQLETGARTPSDAIVGRLVSCLEEAGIFFQEDAHGFGVYRRLG